MSHSGNLVTNRQFKELHEKPTDVKQLYTHIYTNIIHMWRIDIKM